MNDIVLWYLLGFIGITLLLASLLEFMFTTVRHNPKVGGR